MNPGIFSNENCMNKFPYDNSISIELRSNLDNEDGIIDGSNNLGHSFGANINKISEV